MEESCSESNDTDIFKQIAAKQREVDRWLGHTGNYITYFRDCLRQRLLSHGEAVELIGIVAGLDSAGKHHANDLSALLSASELRSPERNFGVGMARVLDSIETVRKDIDTLDAALHAFAGEKTEIGQGPQAQSDAKINGRSDPAKRTGDVQLGQLRVRPEPGQAAAQPSPGRRLGRSMNG